MNATTIGVDLAKQVFAVCVGDDRGHGGQLVCHETRRVFEATDDASCGHGGGNGSV